jgi:hypothetical protein
MDRYSVHNIALLVRVIGQISPEHVLTSYFSSIHFNIILPSTLLSLPLTRSCFTAGVLQEAAESVALLDRSVYQLRSACCRLVCTEESATAGPLHPVRLVT